MVPKFSIIVPVYNSEEFLPKTLDSILCQTLQEFELILVDDGSSDLSGIMCDQYAEIDKRIIVIHKKNGGICSARNMGLSVAKGTYIAFCDNDDICDKNLLRDNYILAEKYDADIVRFSRNWQVQKDGRIISEQKTEFDFGVFGADNFSENFKQIDKSGEGIWAGIYRRNFLIKNKICFAEHMKYGYEDMYFTIQAYMHLPKIVLNPQIYYYWIMRYEHSTSAKVNINNIDSLIECLCLKRQLLDKLNIEQYYPELWLEEISKRAFSVVRYVSPNKVKMPLKERIQIIKYFRNQPIFDYGITKQAKKAFLKKSKNKWFVYRLFCLKRYYLLYYAIMFKQVLDRN